MLSVCSLAGCLIPDSLILAALDRDRDGELNGLYHGEFGDGTDCDDEDPTVGSDMPETCGDNTDNDCDGEIDEDSPEAPIWFLDHDRDGHGDADAPKMACVKPGDHEPDATDCDDNQPKAHPGAVEQCNGFDDDCDGDIDEAGDPVTWYADQDGDGRGDPTSARVACQRPAGHLQDATDCDDGAAWVHPGAVEVWYDGIDGDCAGDDDFDRDGDVARDPSAWAGSPPWGVEADCDDDDPRIRPGAVEVWYDGIDQDCDPSTEWDRDADGVTVFGAPEGSADDCDDSRADVRRPGAWYPDDDGDGFGATVIPTLSCQPLAGHVGLPGDCNDDESLIHPLRPEVCDGIDNNCNGAVDDGVGDLFWPDADNDGRGDMNGVAVQACTRPSGYSAYGDDCDDDAFWRTPGRDETCDGLDNDCDEVVDEGVRLTFYPDADGDGFGASNGLSVSGCAPPDGAWTEDHQDCDDEDNGVFPGATETCDEQDDDCDGDIDEFLTQVYYPDADGDGVGADRTANNFVHACSQPDGYVPGEGDCDDADPRVYGGADETEFASEEDMIAAGEDPEDWRCDGIDNDCDGSTQADPPVGCGAAARLDWGGSRYMLWDRFGHAAEVGESWCAARGYHLWWLAAGEGAEHTVVMNAFGVHPGARVHIGARTRCPGTSEVRQCLPVGPLAWDCYVPFERLYWHDPVAGTCAAAWDDLPSAFALDHPSLSSSHRVVHALNTFPFLTDHEVVSATTAAIVICETEIP